MPAVQMEPARRRRHRESLVAVFLLLVLFLLLDEADLTPDAGDTLVVQDEEHVHARDGLRGQPRRAHAQLAFTFFPAVAAASLVASAAVLVLGAEGELDVARTSFQVVGAMVAANDHNRRDLVGPTRHGDLEMLSEGDLFGRFRDDWSGRQAPVCVEQVWWPKDLSVGNPEIRIPDRKPIHRKRWVVGPNQDLSILPRDEYRGIRQQHGGPVKTPRDSRLCHC